jgi:capsular exopolysaccharide synthesis family protein
MTTLPQTSPMRLPRPNPSQLSIPSANGHLGQVAHPAPTPLTGQDIWRVIRANLWLIIGLMALAAVAGYFINMWLLAKFPRYTSTALIEVHTPQELPAMPDENRVMVADSNPASIEVEQQTQASMLTNRSFLASILQDKNSPIRNTNWFRQWGPDHMDDAKLDLEKKLDVSPKPNTRLIGASFSASFPQDALTIVRAISKRHIELQTQKVQDLQTEKLKVLSELIDQYQSQLTMYASQKNTQSQKLAEFASSDDTNAVSGLDTELVAAIQEKNYAYRDMIEAKSEYDVFVTAVSNNMTPTKLSEYLAKSGTSLQERADALESQLTIARATYGANSQQVKVLQTAVDDAKAKAEDHDGQRRQEGIAILKLEAQGKFNSAQQRYDEAVKKYDARKKDEQAKAAAKLEMTRLKELEKTTENLKEKAEQQQRNLSILSRSSAASTANFFLEPDLPESPSFPKLPITMTLAVALGLMISLGIAFLREFTDTSVRSPRDIAKVGQLNLLGMIPHEADDPESQGARLPLAIFEAPNSIIAEQFRQVRTRLQHSASLDTVRSLLVTGTSPADGKTTVACNLAAGLALNGRRILLVDANFRRPQVHAVLNIPNETGFGDVLNSLDLFDSAVRETEIPNLSVLPTGAKPANSTELLESQLLIDFIERALEEYDHVIFDSGPLLLVSETAALAPRVDGVVTVVRARGNSRGMLQRLRDQLRQLKAENLGVVLNAVRAQTGGYYAPMIKSYYAYQNT